MDANSLIEIIKESMPVVHSSISAIVGATITTLFLRSNTKTTEFEKIKAGHFKEVIDSLLKHGKMSYYEYHKANNFLEIAKLADKMDNGYSEGNSENTADYDFDWFIRFFDSASNISNEKMQELWAAVLAGKVKKRGLFSFRTLDVLHSMSQEEAVIFEQFSVMILDYSMILTSFGMVGESLNESYGFDNDALRLLEEIGILNGLLVDHSTVLEVGESMGFESGGSILLLSSNLNEPVDIEFKGFKLTMAGVQLCGLVQQQEKSFGYLYDLGKEIKERFPQLKVTLHSINGVEGEHILYDDTIDLLIEQS